MKTAAAVFVLYREGGGEGRGRKEGRNERWEDAFVSSCLNRRKSERWKRRDIHSRSLSFTRIESFRLHKGARARTLYISCNMYACIAAAIPLWCVSCLSVCLSVSDGELRSACDSSPHTFVLLIGDGVGSGVVRQKTEKTERDRRRLYSFTLLVQWLCSTTFVSRQSPCFFYWGLSRHCSILSFFFLFQNARQRTNEWPTLRAMRRIRKKGEEYEQQTTDLFQKGERGGKKMVCCWLLSSGW